MVLVEHQSYYQGQKFNLIFLEKIYMGSVSMIMRWVCNHSEFGEYLQGKNEIVLARKQQCNSIHFFQ